MVRQGDPCGPLLFFLALQSPLKKMRDAFPDVRKVAYADDVHLHGPPEAAIEAFRLLDIATAETGLAPSLPALAILNISPAGSSRFKNMKDYMHWLDCFTSVKAKCSDARGTPARRRPDSSCCLIVLKRKSCICRPTTGTDKTCSPHCRRI
jgi:hypothetical protein